LVMLLTAQPWTSPFITPELVDANRWPGPKGSSYVQLRTKMCGMSSALLRAGIRTFASCGAIPAGVMLSSVRENV